MVLPLDTRDNQRVIGDEQPDIQLNVRVGWGRRSRDISLQGHKSWKQFEAVSRGLLRIIDQRVA